MNGNVFVDSVFEKMEDHVIHPGGLRLTRRLLKYCAFPLGAKVVDVGCGTGITVECLNDLYGLHAVGIEVSATLLQQGKKRSPDLALLQASGEELPFANHSFNGAVLECSLSIMQNVDRVLGEINRILVPRGKLAIADVYVRVADTANTSFSPSCILTDGALRQTLINHNFKILLWEDQSALLKEFVASFIMAYGSAEKLWQCLLAAESDNKNMVTVMKTTKFGYFMLIAEKNNYG